MDSCRILILPLASQMMYNDTGSEGQRKGESIEGYLLREDWQRVELGDVILSIKNGITAKQNFSRKGFPVARIETISGGIMNPERVGWVDLPVEDFKDFKLSSGDILFSHINSVGRLGNCAIYEGFPENLHHGMNLLRIVVNKSVLVPYFLLYWLRSDYCRGYYVRNARRAIGQASLNQRDIRRIPVPLPPLYEQNRIASRVKDLMEEMERLQTACKRQLEAASALPDAYLRQAFKREVVEKWERRKLGELCDSETGIWGETPDGSSEYHFVLRSNNIRDGKIDFSDIAVRRVESRHLLKKTLKKGDILVATSSGSSDLVGKSALFIPPDNRTYLFSNFTMRLRAIPGLVDSLYLYFYLQSPQAKSVLRLIQDTTTGLRNLNRKGFLKQWIPIPSSLWEQRLIASRLKEKLAEVERIKIAVQSELKAIDLMPQAVLRKAFMGRL